jgi:hypothetical protein
MNEQIRELAEQAGITTNLDTDPDTVHEKTVQ